MGFKTKNGLINYYLDPDNYVKPQFMYRTSAEKVYFKTQGSPSMLDMKEVHPKMLFLLGLRL